MLFSIDYATKTSPLLRAYKAGLRALFNISLLLSSQRHPYPYQADAYAESRLDVGSIIGYPQSRPVSVLPSSQYCCGVIYDPYPSGDYNDAKKSNNTHGFIGRPAPAYVY